MAVSEELVLSYTLSPAGARLFSFVLYVEHLLITLFKEKVLLFKNGLKMTSLG